MKWIKAVEQEPPLDKSILIIVEDEILYARIDIVNFYKKCRAYNFDHENSFILNIDAQRITHWMLIPEFPK